VLSEAILILGSIMETLEEEDKPLEVFRFFDVAVVCGSVEAVPLDGNRLQFTLAGTEQIVYAGFGHQLRFILAQIGLNVDEIRFPELGLSMEFSPEEIAQEAMRMGIPAYLPEDEDFQLQSVQGETRPRRLEQVYLNLSSRRRLQQSERGIERVNKYGFEVNINYPYKNGTVVPLQVKVSNDRMKPPYYLYIENARLF
jgi:hypothetical protein